MAGHVTASAAPAGIHTQLYIHVHIQLYFVDLPAHSYSSHTHSEGVHATVQGSAPGVAPSLGDHDESKAQGEHEQGTGGARALAIMYFWAKGTLSGPHSTPRSPRATIMESDLDRMSSRLVRACTGRELNRGR